MERNVAYVQQSESLHQAARELAGRAVDTAKLLLASQMEPEKVARGGRKGNQPMLPESPAELAAMMEAMTEAMAEATPEGTAESS